MNAKSFYIGFCVSQQSSDSGKTEVDGIAREIIMLKHAVVFAVKCGHNHHALCSQKTRGLPLADEVVVSISRRGKNWCISRRVKLIGAGFFIFVPVFMSRDFEVGSK